MGSHWQTADSGLLTVTNRRVIYSCGRKTLEFPYAKLATLNTYTDGIGVGVTRCRSTSTFGLAEPELVAGMIRAAYKASGS